MSDKRRRVTTSAEEDDQIAITVNLPVSCADWSILGPTEWSTTMLFSKKQKPTFLNLWGRLKDRLIYKEGSTVPISDLDIPLEQLESETLYARTITSRERDLEYRLNQECDQRQVNMIDEQIAALRKELNKKKTIQADITQRLQLRSKRVAPEEPEASPARVPEEHANVREEDELIHVPEEPEEELICLPEPSEAAKVIGVPEEPAQLPVSAPPLREPRIAVVPTKRRYHCAVCAVYFCSEYHYDQHCKSRRHREKVTPTIYPCPHCGKAFRNNKFNCDRHARVCFMRPRK